MRRAPLDPSQFPTGSPPAEGPAEGPAEDDRPLALLIGNELGLRTELRARLDSAYDVAEAASVVAGVALAGHIQPDLLVAAVNARDLDGVTLLKTLREDPQTAALPFVLLSAGTLDVAEQLGVASGLGRLLADREPPVLHPTPAPAVEPDTNAFAARVDDHVRGEMSDTRFGTRALAERLGLSPRQLRRRLTLATGETPAQHIRRVRMKAAAEMLAGGARVKATGFAVGFASDSGFRTAFRLAFGVAPSEYAASSP